MTETILLSITKSDFQDLIAETVTACLRRTPFAVPAEQPDQFLTIEQAAELLNLKVPTLYGLVSGSEIPVMKKGKRLYFSKEELTEWVKAGRKKTSAETAAEAANYTTRKKR